MNDTFEKALKFTLQWEGGYVNHPNDSGGPTNKGITQKTYDAYRRGDSLPIQSVQKIEDYEISDIYYSLYWLPISIFDASPKLAIAAFDFAVHSGVARATKLLQEVTTHEELLSKREEYLKTIGVGKNAIFLKGWLNRINALRKYLEEV